MIRLRKWGGWLFLPVLVFAQLICQLRFWMVLLLAAGLVVWVWRGAQQPATAPVVPETLAQAVRAAASQLPHLLPPPERALRPTLVLPLADDRELLVTGTVRQVLNADGRYRPVDPSLVQRVLDEFFALAGAARPPVTDAATALQIGQAAGAEVVVFGHVEQLALKERHAEVAFRLQAVEVATEQPLLADRFSWSPEAATPRAPPRAPLTWFALAALALIWPPITVPLMARVLRMENNLATFLTILAVTAVPAAIAWPVFFGSDLVTWRLVLFVVGLLLIGLWTTLVMSWVAEYEDAK